MNKREKRTCRACKAIVFAHKICKFVTFSLPSPLSLLKLSNLLNFQLKKEAARANLNKNKKRIFK